MGDYMVSVQTGKEKWHHGVRQFHSTYVDSNFQDADARAHFRRLAEDYYGKENVLNVFASPMPNKTYGPKTRFLVKVVLAGPVFRQGIRTFYGNSIYAHAHFEKLAKFHFGKDYWGLSLTEMK
jgi:hypothetical protein